VEIGLAHNPPIKVYKVHKEFKAQPEHKVLRVFKVLKVPQE
jgi:hypothetical protein